jgi:molybdopterin-binding protein
LRGVGTCIQTCTRRVRRWRGFWHSCKPRKVFISQAVLSLSELRNSGDFHETQRAQGHRRLEVTKGQTTSHVRLDIGGSQTSTASLTKAVDEPKLAKGQRTHAVIKASDVMIAID